MLGILLFDSKGEEKFKNFITSKADDFEILHLETLKYFRNHSKTTLGTYRIVNTSFESYETINLEGLTIMICMAVL